MGRILPRWSRQVVTGCIHSGYAWYPENGPNAQLEGHFDITKVGAVPACLVPPSPFTSMDSEFKFRRPLILRGGGCISFPMGYLKLMSFKYRNKKTGMAAMRARESGFSMVELMIVCVVMVIIAGMAVPNIFQTYRNYQLDAAGH